MVKGKRRILLLSLLALMVLAATVSLVNAYYVHRSNDLVSEFSPADSQSVVQEEPVGTAEPDDSATNVQSTKSDDSDVAESNDDPDQG